MNRTKRIAAIVAYVVSLHVMLTTVLALALTELVFYGEEIEGIRAWTVATLVSLIGAVPMVSVWFITPPDPTPDTPKWVRALLACAFPPCST